jgi:cell division septum initiation protein DivIVA
MEVIKLLEYLEEIIDNAFTIPLTGKCSIDKEEACEILTQIRIKLPDEIKQAQWIKDERQRILIDAQREAESIIKEAEKHIKDTINEHEIIKIAQGQAKEITNAAQKTAKEIRIGSKEYADDVLQQVELKLSMAMEEIRKNREELRKTK